jgi:hypothetical protein
MRGRRPVGKSAMSAAERSKRYREKRRADKITKPIAAEFAKVWKAIDELRQAIEKIRSKGDR